MAQRVRAILLASATAATFFGRRASKLISQGEARPGLANRMTAVAPSTGNRVQVVPLTSNDRGRTGNLPATRLVTARSGEQIRRRRWAPSDAAGRPWPLRRGRASLR